MTIFVLSFVAKQGGWSTLDVDGKFRQLGLHGLGGVRSKPSFEFAKITGCLQSLPLLARRTKRRPRLIIYPRRITEGPQSICAKIRFPRYRPLAHIRERSDSLIPKR